MTTRKIFISTSTFGQYSQKPLHVLKRFGFQVILNPYGRRLQPSELLGLIKGSVGLIAGTEYLDDTVFSRTPFLRVISRCGSGLDTVDIQAARRRGIQVYTTPEAPVEAVSELTIGLILGVLRRLPEADRALRQDVWKPLMGQLLIGKTVGIIGLGRIGRRMVELLQPFHVNVLAWENQPQLNFVKRYRIRLSSLSFLLRRSDIVSLHVTLDRQTRGMIGAHQFAQMKRTVILVNTSRGELIDEHALLRALKHKRIAGVGLDVFQSEPYSGPLTQCPNAFLSCHMGSYAVETRIAMEMQAVDNLLHGLKD